jgi:hypothetical protein
MAEHMKKPANWPYPDKANIVAATDGTEIKVARPTKNAIGNKHYSAKKKQYALNVLLVVMLSGVIIFCSPPFPKMNDQSLFNEFDIRQRFIGKPWASSRTAVLRSIVWLRRRVTGISLLIDLLVIRKGDAGRSRMARGKCMGGRV